MDAESEEEGRSQCALLENTGTPTFRWVDENKTKIIIVANDTAALAYIYYRLCRNIAANDNFCAQGKKDGGSRIVITNDNDTCALMTNTELGFCSEFTYIIFTLSAVNYELVKDNNKSNLAYRLCILCIVAFAYHGPVGLRRWTLHPSIHPSSKNQD